MGGGGGLALRCGGEGSRVDRQGCFLSLCHPIRTLTLKALITTAADDIHKYFFIVFQGK